MNWFLNLFRKNKRFIFYPDHASTGTGPAVCEFVRYKEELEKATEAKIVMVKSYESWGFERIIYEIREKKCSKN